MAAPIDGLRSLFDNLAIKMSERYVPTTLAQKAMQASQLVAGLRHQISRHVLHGDIKPPNIFWNNEEAVIADYGTAKIIPEMIALMKPEFRMRSESDKNQMKVVVDALQSGDAARTQAAIARNPDQFEMLKAWGVVSLSSSTTTAQKIRGLFSKKEPETPTLSINSDSLTKLHQYLRTEFLPAKSVGYACATYTQAIVDYFWRCEPENLERACNAFDQRALGVTLYEVFTASEPPLGQQDALLYYAEMEWKLKRIGLSREIAKLIRQLAEPIRDFDTASGVPFPVPCTDDELATLQRLLSDFSKPDSAAAAH